MSTPETRQRVMEIMAETESRLTAEIGSPVSVTYQIKVNRVNAQIIIQQVLAVFGITYSDMISKSKEHQFCVPRQITAWLITYYTGSSQEQIAAHINRDRSMVSKSIDRVNDMLDTCDELYIKPLREIELRIKQIIANAPKT